MIGRLIRSARRRWGSYRGVRRLKRLAQKSTPVRIVLGASGIFDAGWIPTDIGTLDILNERHWIRSFAENSIDAILAEHVWEHLSLEQGRLAAQTASAF